MTNWEKYKNNLNKKRWRKEMCDRMPYLKPRQTFFVKGFGDELEDYDYEFICGEEDLPIGWFTLFLQMCEDIRQPLIDNGQLDAFFFHQIKEKYGTMRCYCGTTSKEVLDIINKYEYLSQFICMHCGKPATKETKGWIAYYCDECYKECFADIDFTNKYNDIKFDPIMKYRKSTGDGWETFEVDCSDEWNRLMGD